MLPASQKRTKHTLSRCT